MSTSTAASFTWLNMQLVTIPAILRCKKTSSSTSHHPRPNVNVAFGTLMHWCGLNRYVSTDFVEKKMGKLISETKTHGFWRLLFPTQRTQNNKKLWILFEACWSPWCCFFSSTAPGHSEIILEKSNGQTWSKRNLHVTSLNWWSAHQRIFLFWRCFKIARNNKILLFAVQLQFFAVKHVKPR